MKDCCSKSMDQDSPLLPVCPKCGHEGRSVPFITLENLIMSEQLKKVKKDKKYSFCAGSDCSVVYFENSGEGWIDQGALKVPVTQKDNGADIPVCYCFGFHKGEVKQEVLATGRSDVPNIIQEKMKHSGCSCETKNPQGSCCLGNVRDWIRKIQKTNS